MEDMIKEIEEQEINAYSQIENPINNLSSELVTTIITERINLKVSDQFLSERIGCSLDEIHAIETGIFENEETVMKILDFFRIDVEPFQNMN